MMKFVLNAIAAKRIAFGGFQVACNFFRASLKDDTIDWYYLLSQDVADALGDEIPKELFQHKVYVFPNQPRIKSFFKVKKELTKIVDGINPDVIYSVAAPSYFTFKSPEVMRCANAWSVVGGVNKYALQVTPFKLKFRRFIMAKLTHWQMRKTKYFVTQSQIAKRCILRTVHTSPDNVCVVSNVLPEKYQRSKCKKNPHEGYNMVYASSPAYHKDYLILPQMASVLVNEYKMRDFKIHYTIPENALIYPTFLEELKKYGVEDYFVNHGFLKQEEMVELLSQCDLGLFPSLLETFSVTLLEYMYFELPIVASDLDFNKEVAEDAAIYFKPRDAEDFAKAIFNVYDNQNIRDTLLEKAVTRLALFSKGADKYEETVSFLRRVAGMRESTNNN